MIDSTDEPVALPTGVKGAVFAVTDFIGRSRQGQRLLLKLVDVAQSSMGLGNYDDSLKRTGERRLIDSLAQSLGPLTALDIGAHHGTWSMEVLKRSSRNRVIAVEPDPQSFKTLEANLGGSLRSFAVNAGVGTEDGEGTLFIDDSNSQLSTLLSGMADRIPEGRKDGSHSEVQVHVTQLHTLLERLVADSFIESPKEVNVIKIDTEGFELPILRQVTEQLPDSVSAIQFEFNTHALAQGQLIDDFQKVLGSRYHLFRLAPRRLIHRRDLSFSAANSAGFSNWVAAKDDLAAQLVDLYQRQR